MAEFWAAIGGFIEEHRILFNILLIIAVAIVVNWLLRKILTHTVRGVVRGVKQSQAVDSTAELTAGPHLNARAVQRTRTLGSFGRNVITWLTVIIAFFLILAQFDVNLTAIITSAGFVAAGLAFGAQNLVKDVLNGLFMVFEDQLGVGDWVTCGDVSGTVEDVGIRVTRVRGIDGTLWFVRNGEILVLGNSSQGWGRALIDITVNTNCDMDEVERVSLEAAQELLHSADTARKVSGEPEIWGIESAYGDRATLRLALRTRPEAQWTIQRALRGALMRHFKQAGIELATEMPHFPGSPE